PSAESASSVSSPAPVVRRSIATTRSVSGSTVIFQRFLTPRNVRSKQIALPEGIHENLKSLHNSSWRFSDTSASCPRICGSISDLTSLPPAAAIVQKVGTDPKPQTQTEILLPSGCHAADFVENGCLARNSVNTSRGWLPSRLTTSNWFMSERRD